MSAKLLVLSGPSAVGKGTLASFIIANNEDFELSVSATTRSARSGEVAGESYIFVTDQEFSKLIESAQLLEWATVHGQHRYGTPRLPVEKALAEGKNVVLEIDVQGAFQVKQALNKRGTESPEDKRLRLETAKSELLQAESFDFQVINDEVARCAQEVVDLVKSN
jgi:guanylate kinase